jgi:hypothetical protein
MAVKIPIANATPTRGCCLFVVVVMIVVFDGLTRQNYREMIG